MGCSFSSRSSSSSSVRNKSIRLVHLNGHIHEFDHPVTVYEVTRISPNHFVSTPAQLLSAYSNPLMPNTLLKPDQIYFLLPLSVFQSAASPDDFKPIVKNLVNIAKSKHSKNQIRSCRSPLQEENVTQEQGGQPWKPSLATIRERSFNRMSESNLQENEL